MGADGTSGVPGIMDHWTEGLDEETEFWRRWLAAKGEPWGFDYCWRTDPQAPLQPFVTAHLAAAGDPVRLVDVGSGPLTILGKRWGGRRLEIVAVDPIADRYASLLREAGLTPSVPMVQGDAEDLASVIPRDSFDLAFARNCLDHSHDPLRCIRQMLEVVKPSGVVLLAHAIDEGEFMEYAGPHQWNFREERGRFVIWRPGLRIDVTSALGRHADIAVESFPEHRYMSVALRRSPEQKRWRLRRRRRPSARR